jgi:AraC-like DNA-binding protein
MPSRNGQISMSLRQDSFLDDRYLVRGFAWDYPDGHELPVHTHAWAQLAYAGSGVMQVQTDDASWLVPPTRAIWIPADVAHWIRMRGPVAMRSIYVPAGVGSGWPDNCVALEVLPLLRELILRIVALRWLAPGDARHERLLMLLADLIAESERLPLVLPLPRDPRARRVAQAILAAPGDNVAVAELARRAGASARTVQRLFTAETGAPLENWRLKCRMQQAVILLNAGNSVTAVAHTCGYSSASAFTTAFKRLFGAPPARYRKQDSGP